MSTPAHIVIVGGGLAAASAAKELREQGFAGSIRVIAGETHAPYIRPPLSKGYLQGKEGLDAVYVHPVEWYGEHDIELVTGVRAESVDAEKHTVTLADGTSVPYDKLLLATGSMPRRLGIEGAELAGVHYLRTLDDSQALHELLAAGGKRLVLIGSGWIGMEVGATARELGNEVTILEREAIPLAGAIGDELGTMFAEVHREHGVRIRPLVDVAKIVGENGRAMGVMLADGEVVPADAVLIGVGAVPDVALAESADLTIDNGIVVDASMRTSDPDIFAAGDVANAFHPLAKSYLRSEHWANALYGGPVAARAMLGQEAEFDRIPYFYTDQFELGMEYSGYGALTRGAELVIRGDQASREFVAFWVRDGRVVAGMNVNVWDVNKQVQRLIRSEVVVDVARLADPSVGLETL